ncbi:MAG TPA: PDZ domain-containing protein, partial [Planctomycetota bacterium]|nr:PDZ domain-containing protein [Planctomycetota bacterium]
VEKRLKSEEDRLLKDIEKVIDEELSRAGKAPKAAPKAEAPAPGPKRKARGYMGVKLMELSDEDKKDLGVKGGLKVAEVVEGGPAAKAGLQPDDVVTAVDGRAIDSMQELAPIMQAAGPGASVKLELLHDGKKKTVAVTLAPHPADAQQGEPPKEQGKGEDDLRERVKKFLEKKDAPKDESKPKPKAKGKPAPQEDEADDMLAFDEDMFEQFKEMFEKFGVDPEQFFEKGKDGKYRLNDQMKEMFKNFNLDKFKDLLPKSEEPEPDPAPRKKTEPRKVEPKKAEPRASRPWLGLQPEELPDELRAQLDLGEGEGLLVTQVLAGSPAEQAGLKKNDILTKIDGQAVKGEESLAKFMASAKPGQEATLTVLRKSKTQAIKVTIGEKKD